MAATGSAGGQLRLLWVLAAW